MPGIDRNLPELVDPRGLIDQRSGRPRRVQKRLQDLIALCLSGEVKTIIAGAGRVGLSSSYVYKSLRQPHVRKYISDQTRGKLDEGVILGAARLVNLIHAKSEHVSLDASQHALALAGYRPPQDARGVAININNIVPGYVVNLGPNHQQNVIDHDDE